MIIDPVQGIRDRIEQIRRNLRRLDAEAKSRHLTGPEARMRSGLLDELARRQRALALALGEAPKAE